MKTRFLILLVMIVGTTVLFSGGCVQEELARESARQPKTEDPPPHPFTFIVVRPRVDDILIYLQGIAAMPAAQQEIEFEQARLDFKRSGKPEDRLRLACLSLLPDRTSADRANAARLVDEYLADPKRVHDGIEGLATLLSIQLNELLAAKKLLAVEKERAELLSRRLNEQKTQLDELKTQLNELKKIEKIISDREKAGSPEKQ